MRDEFTPSRTVVLVACVKQKREHPAPARDLYLSAWFKKARAFAERVGDAWYILSANHYLLAPDEVVAPYDTTLLGMTGEEKRRWAAVVIEQARAAFRPTDHVLVLAGREYRTYVVPGLLPFVRDVTVPMAGLGIGQQLAWLGRRVTGPRQEEEPRG